VLILPLPLLHPGLCVQNRTFLESEVTNAKLRADLYDKMVKIDRCALTPDEHACQAVTKLRYMQVVHPIYRVTGFLQVRENWKTSGNLSGQGKVRGKYFLEKSGKMKN